VTTGLLAARAADATTARRVLRSVTMIVEDHPAVRELAGEWLACDAAERSAWRELADDATAMRWPATPLTYRLEVSRCTGATPPRRHRRASCGARWVRGDRVRQRRGAGDRRRRPRAQAGAGSQASASTTSARVTG